jgi:hypothetical protein
MKDTLYVEKQPLPSSTNKTSNEEPTKIYSYDLLRGHTIIYFMNFSNMARVL